MFPKAVIADQESLCELHVIVTSPMQIIGLDLYITPLSTDLAYLHQLRTDLSFKFSECGRGYFASMHREYYNATSLCSYSLHAHIFTFSLSYLLITPFYLDHRDSTLSMHQAVLLHCPRYLWQLLEENFLITDCCPGLLRRAIQWRVYFRHVLAQSHFSC